MPNKILALNFGSTSSKVAYFMDETMLIKHTINHPQNELNEFESFYDQKDYRYSKIMEFLNDNNINVSDIDIFASWGGPCRATEEGAYLINDVLIDDVLSGKYGRHPGDLTPIVLKMLAKDKVAISIDPPTINEFSKLAKYTGIPFIERKSRMQTLNQKAVARKYSEDICKNYDELNLIVCHLGGGISVAMHKHGKMVDANNGLDGDGPMASNRAGTLPAGDLVDLCFDGKHSKKEIKDLITGKGGLVAYLNECDARTIEEKISSGNQKYKEVYDALIYQLAKQIGATATIVKGNVDAIILTGGMANSKYIVDAIKDYCEYIAQVVTYPGELEMESLGKMAYKVLLGKERVKVLEND